jgi:hypothetical protein
MPWTLDTAIPSAVGDLGVIDVTSVLFDVKNMAFVVTYEINQVSKTTVIAGKSFTIKDTPAKFDAVTGEEIDPADLAFSALIAANPEIYDIIKGIAYNEMHNAEEIGDGTLE